MKILAIADEENKAFWDYFDASRIEGVDLIISSGDLKPQYLEFIETMINCPLLYVHGNHDTIYDRRPPEGCTCIEDKIYDYHGLRILGLGGSMRYHAGNHMYTESEMEKRIRKLNRTIALHNGFDILVTHAPAKGYGDMDDLPHLGFECFNKLLLKWKPKYMIHGHVHKNYGQGFERERIHESGTKIMNVYDHQFLNIQSDEYPEKGKTGSFLYDLYVSLSKSKGRNF